jgi:hypothetical protein
MRVLNALRWLQQVVWCTSVFPVPGLVFVILTGMAIEKPVNAWLLAPYTLLVCNEFRLIIKEDNSKLWY